MNKLIASKAGAQDWSQQEKNPSPDTAFLPYNGLSIQGAK